jgi:hypothetical protein
LFKNYGFSLRAKNKLLLETKGSESIGVASHAGGQSEVSLMHASLLSFPCWLLSRIKVYYINTRWKSYFSNVGYKALYILYVHKIQVVFFQFMIKTFWNSLDYLPQILKKLSIKFLFMYHFPRQKMVWDYEPTYNH